MRTHHYDEEYFHRFETDDYFSTFGGEIDEDDLIVDEYGIQVDNVSISHIPSEKYKNLAIQMINHLMLNGHTFCFIKDQEGIKIISHE